MFSEIFLSIIRGDETSINRYLMDGGDANIFFHQNNTLKQSNKINQYEGYTLLHFAVHHEQVNIARLLLEHEANPDGNSFLSTSHQDKSHTQSRHETSLLPLPPLHMAVLNNNPTMVHLLLSYNADVNLRCPAYKTPLHFATEQAISSGHELELLERIKIVRTLLKYRANPDLVDNNDRKAGELAPSIFEADEDSIYQQLLALLPQDRYHPKPSSPRRSASPARSEVGSAGSALQAAAPDSPARSDAGSVTNAEAEYSPSDSDYSLSSSDRDRHNTRTREARQHTNTQARPSSDYSSDSFSPPYARRQSRHLEHHRKKHRRRRSRSRRNERVQRREAGPSMPPINFRTLLIQFMVSTYQDAQSIVKSPDSAGSPLIQAGQIVGDSVSGSENLALNLVGSAVSGIFTYMAGKTAEEAKFILRIAKDIDQFREIAILVADSLFRQRQEFANLDIAKQIITAKTFATRIFDCALKLKLTYAALEDDGYSTSRSIAELLLSALPLNYQLDVFSRYYQKSEAQSTYENTIHVWEKDSEEYQEPDSPQWQQYYFYVNQTAAPETVITSTIWFVNEKPKSEILCPMRQHEIIELFAHQITCQALEQAKSGEFHGYTANSKKHTKLFDSINKSLITSFKDNEEFIDPGVVGNRLRSQLTRWVAYNIKSIKPPVRRNRGNKNVGLFYIKPSYSSGCFGKKTKYHRHLSIRDNWIEHLSTLIPAYVNRLTGDQRRAPATLGIRN